MKITKEIIITILVLLVTIFGVVYTNKAISGRQSERLKNSNTILSRRVECNEQVDENYHRLWREECEFMGLETDCRLPSYRADSFGEIQEQQKKDCNYLYQ